jgi:hypothetical protein
MLLRVDLMRQRVAFTCREVSSQGLPPPRSPSKLLFSKLFMYFSVYFYCLQVNSNCLGFRLFVYVRDLLSIVLTLHNLFGFLGSWIRSKLSSLSLFIFFGSRIRSKFIGVLKLPMVYPS